MIDVEYLSMKQLLTGIFNDESATDRPDLMTDAEYAEAYQKMAADYFQGKEAQENPALLYVTGLPGAGKSTFVDKAKAENPPLKNYVHINFDALRLYHPRYNEHIKQDPINAAARMDKAVEGLIGWLCQEAAKRKLNVILDDAAVGAEMTRIVLSPFHANGYSVSAIAVAAPAIVARQSVRLRFEEDFASAKAGKPVIPRWVNTEEQNNAPAALVETLEIIERERLASSITIIDRAMNKLYPSDQPSSDARTVIEETLLRKLSPEERVVFQNNEKRIVALVKSRTSPKNTAITPRKSL